MLAPPKANAARPGKVGGAAEQIKKLKPQSSSASHGEVQLPLLDSSHVDIDTLEVMANWRHSLTCRIHRAQIRFELADTDVPELHDLAREVADFSKCCRALMWRPEAA